MAIEYYGETHEQRGGRYMMERAYVKTVSAKDLKSLFEDEFGRLKQAVDAGKNTALVSEPYAGRDMLLDELSSNLGGAERVSFGSVADAEGDVPEDADVYLVEGCRYLYTRRIDGFENLESFIDGVAESEATVVASWNLYAWSYVRQATEVDDVFREDIVLPELGTSSIAEVIASEYDITEFKSDLEETREEGGDITDRLPAGIRFRLGERSDNVFEQITALSGGNLGVARSVFESRTWEDGSEDDVGELSYEDAFMLLVILTKEDVEHQVLEEVVYLNSLEKSIRKLSDAGYVESDDGRVTLRPERLVNAVERLERRNLVW